MRYGWTWCVFSAVSAFAFQGPPLPPVPPRPMPQQQATMPPQQPAGPATSSIEGQVFHGATGAPLKRASVRLVGIGRRQQGGGMPSMLTKETDDAGRFSFTNLEAGRYSLTAERQGFLRQNYGGRKYNTSGTP